MLNDLVRMIDSIKQEKTILGAWIYGSAAWDADRSPNDIDLIVVAKEAITPEHHRRALADGTPVSINLIGGNSLSEPSCDTNGGFFFTFKYFAPCRKILGDDEECEALLGNAVAHLICPWVFFLLPQGRTEEVLTVDQITALLYLLKIHINPHYVLYFAKWHGRSVFPTLWEQSRLLVRRALAYMETYADVRVDSVDGQVTWIAPDRDSDLRRIILLEQLTAGFWHFNCAFRREEQHFLEKYFRHQVRDSVWNIQEHVASSVDFLHERAGSETVVRVAGQVGCARPSAG